MPSPASAISCVTLVLLARNWSRSGRVSAVPSMMNGQSFRRSAVLDSTHEALINAGVPAGIDFNV